MARIMVVEDEPITAMDLEQLLVAIGHEVAGWFDTGEDAVRRAGDLHPDLVLMDIRLRGEMSGVEAAAGIRRAARDRGESTPIVFITAFADEETVDAASETRPFGYLVKPFTERSVAAAVQVALARAAEERETVERERFFSSALGSLGEALVAVDGLARVRFVNESALALLGAAEDELIGRRSSEVLSLLCEGEVAPDFFGLALREGRLSELAGTLRAAGGVQHEIRGIAGPMLGPDGSILGAVGAFRPVASQARAFAPTAQEMSGRVQHEINSPLTYNLGALAIAIREIDTLRAARALGRSKGEARGDDEVANRLARIESLVRSAHEGATRIATVMEELRSPELLELERVTIHPAEVLELAVGACAGVLESAKVTRDMRRTPLIRANRWQLARVLADELRGALAGDAAPIALRLSTGSSEEGHAVMRIELRSIRGRFGASPSAGEARGGVGHGARLVVTDQGSTRRIELQLPPAESVPAERGLRGSVLVVDDEPMVGRVLELMLGPHHDVVAVESAASALELIEGGSPFDVILCDLSMPEMSGRELYERVARSFPEAAERFVFISGGALDPASARFLERHAGRRLDKPLTAERLLPLLAARVDAARARVSA